MDTLKDLRFKDLQIIGQSADRSVIFSYHTKRRRIICFDQHAADERIRFEQILNSLDHIKDLDLIKSKACHGAIRVGCRLTLRQCQILIYKLLKCKVPFRCAHSRCGVCVLESLDKILFIERMRNLAFVTGSQSNQNLSKPSSESSEKNH